MKPQNVSLEGKTILVTGAAGFIGSNLVLELLRTTTTIHIVGIDNMNDYYDVSIKEYRLEQAAVELVRSRKPITEIAQHAGYDNTSKFSESFKKRYGKTPSRYRADKTNAVKRSIDTKTE